MRLNCVANYYYKQCNKYVTFVYGDMNQLIVETFPGFSLALPCTASIALMW